MSHSPTATATASESSSNFQLIFNNALKSYEKRTKKDLLAHPLAAQLQACDSPSAILAVLQQQIPGLNQSQSSDERWEKWLRPTVHVLYAFSAILGEGVGVVCCDMNWSGVCTLMIIWQVFSPAKVVFAGVGVLLLVFIDSSFLHTFAARSNPYLPLLGS